jgi:hypothetical protein
MTEAVSVWQNILATVYRALGIAPTMTFATASGGPLPLLEYPRPVQKLIG